MRCACAAAGLVLMCLRAFAGDIFTMPTANQLKAKEVDAGVYYVNLNMPPNMPQSVNVQTLNVGVTDVLELDAQRVDVDKDEISIVLIASIKLLWESATTPDVVIGCRNLLGTATTTDPFLRQKTRDRSYFVCSAKTFFLNPSIPGPPLIRAHLSAGTPDWTLGNDKRHDGLFGGLQFLLTRTLGGIALYDGENVIAGLTFFPPKTGARLMGGLFGEHWWVGIAYTNSSDPQIDY